MEKTGESGTDESDAPQEISLASVAAPKIGQQTSKKSKKIKKKGKRLDFADEVAELERELLEDLEKEEQGRKKQISVKYKDKSTRIKNIGLKRKIVLLKGRKKVNRSSVSKMMAFRNKQKGKLLNRGRLSSLLIKK